MINSAQPTLLFKLIDANGSKYELYDDGTALGFPQGTCVVNYALPLLNALRSIKRIDGLALN